MTPLGKSTAIYHPQSPAHIMLAFAHVCFPRHVFLLFLVHKIFSSVTSSRKTLLHPFSKTSASLKIWDMHLSRELYVFDFENLSSGYVFQGIRGKQMLQNLTKRQAVLQLRLLVGEDMWWGLPCAWPAHLTRTAPGCRFRLPETELSFVHFMILTRALIFMYLIFLSHGGLGTIWG